MPCRYVVYFRLYTVHWWNDNWWIGEDLEGNGHGVIKMLSQHLLTGSEETTKILSKGSLCPHWDSNRATLEHEFRVLLLHRPIQGHVAWQTDTNILEKLAASLRIIFLFSEHEDSVGTYLPGYAEDGCSRFLLVPTYQITWHHIQGEVTLTLILVLIFTEISYNEDVSCNKTASHMKEVRKLS